MLFSVLFPEISHIWEVSQILRAGNSSGTKCRKTKKCSRGGREIKQPISMDNIMGNINNILISKCHPPLDIEDISLSIYCQPLDINNLSISKLYQYIYILGVFLGVFLLFLFWLFRSMFRTTCTNILRFLVTSLICQNINLAINIDDILLSIYHPLCRC